MSDEPTNPEDPPEAEQEPETQLGYQSRDERRAAETIALDRDQVRDLMAQAQAGGDQTAPGPPPSPPQQATQGAHAASQPETPSGGEARSELVVLLAVVVAMALLIAVVVAVL